MEVSLKDICLQGTCKGSLRPRVAAGRLQGPGPGAGRGHGAEGAPRPPVAPESRRLPTETGNKSIKPVPELK